MPQQVDEHQLGMRCGLPLLQTPHKLFVDDVSTRVYLKYKFISHGRSIDLNQGYVEKYWRVKYYLHFVLWYCYTTHNLLQNHIKVRNALSFCSLVINKLMHLDNRITFEQGWRWEYSLLYSHLNCKFQKPRS